MNFKCNKDVLLKEISIAQDIISTKNTFSILSYLYLSLKGNNLEIKATDASVNFKTIITVDGITDGETKILCEKFLMIIKAFPDEIISIEKFENEIFLRDENNKVNYNLNSITKEEFPEFKNIQQNEYFSIAQKDFIEMINQTIFSISSDETRYFMNGVCLEKDNEENKLKMISTDGRRLSYIAKSVNNIPDFNQIIIPQKILNIIKKNCSNEGTIDLAISDNTLFVKINDLFFSSNLISGQFPGYKKVIPENQDFSLIINKNELLNALRRVDLMIEKNSTRKIYLDIKTNNLLLKSERSDIGEAKESISCQYEKEEMVIALNSGYLEDPLKVIDTENIEIEFTTSNKAITINAVPKKDYFHIIAPMQKD